MRVFVLTTGRSGSMAFAAACTHLSNFTSGHESRWPADPADRLDYPDQHIEVDNRLVWFLGSLNARYPDARYVHLIRDPEAVARSFHARWKVDPPVRPSTWLQAQRRRFRPQRHPGVSAVTMFAYPMFGRVRPWSKDSRPLLSRMLVETMTANIEHFLEAKPHLTIDLADSTEGFPKFCSWIGAEGDLEAAVHEFSVGHNAT